jgi:hypothetical protein
LGDEEAALAELAAALEAGIGDFFAPLILAPFRRLLEDSEFLGLFGVEGVT